MSLKKISREEFDSFQPTRMPMTEVMAREVEWWKDKNDTIIGLVAKDQTDEDWLYVVMGRDENGQFRAIDVDTNLIDKETAVERLRNSMTEFVRIGKVIFIQDLETRSVIPTQTIEEQIKLTIEPGEAKKEEIARLLARLSILYKMSGGSGINFNIDQIRITEMEVV